MRKLLLPKPNCRLRQRVRKKLLTFRTEHTYNVCSDRNANPRIGYTHHAIDQR